MLGRFTIQKTKLLIFEELDTSFPYLFPKMKIAEIQQTVVTVLSFQNWELCPAIYLETCNFNFHSKFCYYFSLNDMVSYSFLVPY